MAQSFHLPMCAESENSGMDLMIQIVVEKTTKPADIGVSFNGCWPNYEAEPTDELLFPTGMFTHLGSKHQGYNFRFKADHIAEGWNDIVVYNNSLFYEKARKYYYEPTAQERKNFAFCIVSVELAVKPRS